MAQDYLNDTTMGSSSQDSEDQVDAVLGGVLTKTIIQSPVIRWILHARVREKQFNDVVFVGEDFLQVKEVKAHGHLEQIATKSDFDARIRAAKTFTNDPDALEELDEDLFIKAEDDGAASAQNVIPPQCIVLTLDSNDLLFVYLTTDTTGKYRFIHQACPMPTFDRVLFQPGEHLAVDPHSRALAVAASEREVVIYSAKSKESIQAELRAKSQDWCPVSAQRPLQVYGVIQQVDFLIPASDDEDHIILLMIITDQKITKAVWLDWYYSSDLHDAQIHPMLPLDTARSATSLLIPLRNTAFFLTNGSEIKRCRNILSGALDVSTLPPLGIESSYPGASPRRPIWASWCRPRRGRPSRDNEDHLYLIREDGSVHLIRVAVNIQSSNAGDFGCHVGTAFASLGGTRDPDILAVAGDMSTGRVQSIGHWSTPVRVADLDRADTMNMELVETISNWASVTDMVASTLPGKSQRPRDGLFVTSGRQPYGAITELRRGLEARLSVYFELEGGRSVTDVWALPVAAVGQILLVLSSPSATRLIQVSADAEMESIEEVADEGLALDAAHRTLAAAAVSDGWLIQVTEASICVTLGTSAHFEDTAKVELTGGSAILAAAIEPDRSMSFTAQRSDQFKTGYALISHALNTNSELSTGLQIERKGVEDLSSEPLCLASLIHGSSTIVLVSDANGLLNAYAVAEDGNLTIFAGVSLGGPCDHIAILRSAKESQHDETRYLVICGLRNGRLQTFALTAGNDFQLQQSSSGIDLSQSAIKLTQPADDRTVTYAMSGPDTCLLSWDGECASSLSIQNIWVSDKSRPELAQGPVVACTHMPAGHLLSSPDLAGCLVMISGDEFLVTTLERTPATVPRQMPVNGTPNRLLYAEQQRCLVCASLQYEVRSFPSSIPHSKPEERRQTWPVIDFIPSRSSEPSFSYYMQPGERVYALLEWSFKPAEDKIYSFILVGGSYTKSNGSQRGRITFLQPTNKNWAVTDVKEARTTNFEAPVYALALLDDLTYVACVGTTITVSRFSIGERKWESICSPLKLHSPGIYITISQAFIYVSTAEDSLVTLTLDNNNNDMNGDGPGYEYRLTIGSAAPRADALLSHVTSLKQSRDGACRDAGLALTSTKYGQLLGLRTDAVLNSHSKSAELLFEANLPRSLTRLRQGNVRPRWKANSPGLVFYDNIIGCAPDGTLVGIAVLDQNLWRRLSWLQRLCEWSEEISPHSYQTPAYSVGEQNFARNERAMPIGLHNRSTSDIVVRTSRSRLSDGHIDGDVLSRILERGGAETLKQLIRRAADRNDRVGEWMMEHLEEELQAIDEIIELLKVLLDGWL